MPETIEYAPRVTRYYLVIVLAVLVILLGGVVEFKHYSSLNEQRIAALERKNADLSQKIAALSAQPNASAGTLEASAQIKTLEEKLNMLTAQQNSLTQNLVESGNVRGSVAELSSKFKQIETAQQSLETRTHNLLTRLNSFYRLNDAVRSGKPFASELAQMQEFAADQQDIKDQLEKLAPYADTGVPTPWQLKQEFTAAVREAIAPGTAANAKFSERIVANLKRLVTVRRIGAGADEAGPKAAIARAEAHMDRQELEAAYSEIENLGAPYKAAFGDWAEMAEFTIGLPEILLAIQNKILENTEISSNQSAVSSKP